MKARRWARPLTVPALAIALALSACAGSGGASRDWVAPDAGLTSSMSVAVIPFENLTNHPNAGIIVSQLVTTEIYRQGVFLPVEDSIVRNRLADLGIDAAEIGEAVFAQQLAELLGASAVLTGSVSEYGYQHGLREEPTVGFNLRLVAAGDGRVLWAASYSDIGRGVLSRDSVNALAQAVAGRMVSALRTHVRR
ncbi:MAG: GNA1162 family protein [Alphaproteobacteria bacterium]